MISNEQKYILDIVRGIDSVYKNKIDERVLFDELMKHRLFLALYTKVYDYLTDFYKKIFKINRDNLLVKKDNQYNFFKDTIIKLNEIKTDYIILKGFSNEKLIYGNTTSRMFGDLDVFVKEEDFDKCIDYLISKFPNTKLIQNFDYYSHEVRLIITIDNYEYLLELKRRHRGCPYTENEYFFSNVKYVFITEDNIKYPVLNDEALLYSSIVYIYNYFSRKSAYILSRKNRLCYFYDLYLLCKNIDYEKHLLNIIKKNKINLEISHVFEWMKLLFNDNKFDLNIEFESLIPFSIIDCIFNSPLISELLHKYDVKLFNNSEVVSNFKMVCPKNTYNINGDILLKNNILVMNFNINDFILDGTEIIYLVLYGTNIYGEPLYPFLPISVRFLEKGCKIHNRFTINHETGKFNRNSEVDMPYHLPDTFLYKIENDMFNLTVDLSKLKINYLQENCLGYNIELINILDYDVTKVISRVNDNIEVFNYLKKDSDLDNHMKFYI